MLWGGRDIKAQLIPPQSPSARANRAPSNGHITLKSAQNPGSYSAPECPKCSHKAHSSVPECRKMPLTAPCTASALTGSAGLLQSQY